MNDLFNKMNEKYKNRFDFKIIDYTKNNFEHQLNLLNTTCLCIAGIGSARFSTPFLPNGAIEIQTFNHCILNKNFIEYFDYHGGTLSKFIKIVNIPYYTQNEAKENKCSEHLEKYICEELENIPCKVPVDFDNNIPTEIKNLKMNKNYDKMFDVWRNNMTTSIENLMELLQKND